MCGIYAVSGSDNAGSVALAGIKRLEYRGYDSWGVAVADGKKIHLKIEGMIRGGWQWLMEKKFI